MNIAALINKELPSMTKSEYKVAAYLLNSPSEAAFATLEELAERIGTSTTSVIRFCRRLGHHGYKELQLSVRAELKSQPSLPDKFARTVSLSGTDTLLSRILSSVRACLDATFGEVSEKTLSAAVEKLACAERVFLFGMKESFALAHYAYTRLLSVRPGASILSAGLNGEIEELLSLREGDVVVVFLFHRYTDAALRVLDFLRERGIDVILVTAPPCSDSVISGTLPIICRTDIGGIKNSAVAPIAVTDYICNAVALELGESALEYMKSSENLFERFDVLSDR